MSKLLFFDIDGTLIDCNQDIYSIPQSTKNALNQLQKQGDLTFLATGRCKCFIVDGVMNYPFDGYVTCNGAYVEYKGKAVYKKVVSAEAIQKTHELCKKRNMVYYFEGNDCIYVLDKTNKKHIEFRDVWGMKEETIVDCYDFNEVETYIGMIVVNSEKDIKPMVDELSPYFNIQRHQSGLSFDLTLKGESKAKGIEKMVEAIGESMEKTIAFGDGRNDIEMLSTVELSIAMGNAAIEAKEVSNYVTDRIEDDGIVNALYHFQILK